MNKQAIHKTSIVLNAAAAAAAGLVNVSRTEAVMESLDGLGYPPYLAMMLGTCELAAAVTLAAPGTPKFKEWAYAGLTFTYAGAFVSHLAVGEKKESLAPLASLVLLMTAYVSRPKRSQLPTPSAPQWPTAG